MENAPAKPVASVGPGFETSEPAIRWKGIK